MATHGALTGPATVAQFDRVQRRVSSCSGRPDELGRRASGVWSGRQLVHVQMSRASQSATSKEEVLRVLRQMAAAKSGGGLHGLLCGIFAQEEAALSVHERALERMQPVAAAYWSATVRGHQLTVAECLKHHHSSREAEVLAGRLATNQYKILHKSARHKLTQRRKLPARQLQPEAGALSTGRPAAVGTVQNNHSGETSAATRAPQEHREIQEWRPPAVPIVQAAWQIVPRRTARYVPDSAAQRKQLLRVQSWQLRRAIATDDPRDAFFSIGAMSKAIRDWCEREGRESEASPPLEVIESQLHRVEMPTALASNSGHIWSVLDEGPLDARQLTAMLGSAWAGEAVERLIGPRGKRPRPGQLSETEVRAAVGGSTHGASLALAASRAWSRLTKRQRREAGHSIMAVGAGVGLTALQAAHWLGPESVIETMAEPCSKTGPAGEVLVTAHGHKPTMVGRAEDPRLANGALGATLEVDTLRCSPYSKAGRKSDGRGKIEAALTERRKTLLTMAARRPLIVICETTDGLWGLPEVRRRYESLLQDCGAYDWEACRIDPAKHCGVGVGRCRVFYTAVRRGA